MFDIFYKKNDNSLLFKDLEKNDFSNLQNYNPIYSIYFSLDENNYNKINLNHRYIFIKLKTKIQIMNM